MESYPGLPSPRKPVGFFFVVIVMVEPLSELALSLRLTVASHRKTNEPTDNQNKNPPLSPLLGHLSPPKRLDDCCPSTMSLFSSRLLRALYRTNQAILSQKLSLLSALETRHGPETARDLYKSVCPLVGASIGQHMRHSMDHLELAILVATQPDGGGELHYDLRVRGGTAEYDMDIAKSRIENLVQELNQSVVDIEKMDSSTTNSRPVRANFMLSGDGTEFALDSTVERELGFVAHHAIHHMAMIKLIATNHAGLDKESLPLDFGRAPSTVHHDGQE